VRQKTYGKTPGNHSHRRGRSHASRTCALSTPAQRCIVLCVSDNLEVRPLVEVSNPTKSAQAVVQAWIVFKLMCSWSPPKLLPLLMDTDSRLGASVSKLHLPFTAAFLEQAGILLQQKKPTFHRRYVVFTHTHTHAHARTHTPTDTLSHTHIHTHGCMSHAFSQVTVGTWARVTFIHTNVLSLYDYIQTEIYTYTYIT